MRMLFPAMRRRIPEDDPTHSGSKMSVRDTTGDQDGLPAQLLYSSVRQSYNEYDAAGRLVQSADAYGQSTSTTYTALGQVDTTTDAFGGVTTNTYDLKGNLIRTVYPDGTETRSVYDAMGRVIWSNGRFDPASGDTVLATHMIYDSLGQVVKTERYKDAEITIGSDPQYPSLFEATAPAAPVLLSTASTVYNDQGQVAEAVDASGLRMGTLYYPNGQVHYSGPLKGDAPANWYKGGDPTQYFREVDSHKDYTTYAYDQTDSLPSGIGAVRYDSVTDALSNTTRSYKDALGRVIRTTYADDTFTQTLYGVNGQPVTDHEVEGRVIRDSHLFQGNPGQSLKARSAFGRINGDANHSVLSFAAPAAGRNHQRRHCSYSFWHSRRADSLSSSGTSLAGSRVPQPHYTETSAR